MRKIYKSFDDLPLCLNVQDVADVLGICKPLAYEVVNRKDFPAIRIGENNRRIIVPRDKFKLWIDNQDNILSKGEI